MDALQPDIRAGKYCRQDAQHRRSDCTGLYFWFAAVRRTRRAPSGSVYSAGRHRSYIWGVQLEIGSVATPLEKPDPQQDLAKCQRFCVVSSDFVRIKGYAAAGFSIGGIISLPVTMRGAPTVLLSSQSYVNASAAAVSSFNTQSVTISASVTAAGDAVAAFFYSASADL